MRFGKSIQICKGVRVNVSESGVSLTAGIRGASINIGKKGVYLNTSIPGTGIHNNQKLFSLNNQDPVGSKVSESAEGVEQKNDLYINLFKLSPPIISEETIKKMQSNLVLAEYEKMAFDIKEPDEGEIKKKLLDRAKNEIKGLEFWKTGKKRSEFVDTMYSDELKKQTDKWKLQKEEFNNEQEMIKTSKDSEYKKEYLEKQKIYDLILTGDQEYVESEIETLLKTLEVPVDFSVQFEYKNGDLFIDMDLPEIEDIPGDKIRTLPTGKIKINNKTQLELKGDYITCVCGLAFFVGAHCFNISTRIANITISGYTQRLNKGTGNFEDEYIYSIRFEREKFAKMNIRNIDPLEAFKQFENITDITNAFVMKKIIPF